MAVLNPEPDHRESDAAGFVLAGGRSSRMGNDKAFLDFGGQPLVSRALSILQCAGLPASIAGGSDGLSGFASMVADAHPGQGPLAGICSGLAATSAGLAAFITVDTPLLPASLLTYLLHHARVTEHAFTIASVNGFAETFPAVISRVALPALKAELDSGRNGCFAAFQAAASKLGQSVRLIPIELIVQSGHAFHPQRLLPMHWFLNVNSPADLERARALTARMIA